jgi:hypothetical protein
MCLPPAFTLVSSLAYSSTLKMKAKCSSETSVDFQRTSRRYIPDDTTLHDLRCENLKSHTRSLLFFLSSQWSESVFLLQCRFPALRLRWYHSIIATRPSGIFHLGRATEIPHRLLYCAITRPVLLAEGALYDPASERYGFFGTMYGVL